MVGSFHHWKVRGEEEGYFPGEEVLGEEKDKK